MKKGAKHPSPSRATALAHRYVVTHRIGLLSVTLRSDIVALLRKKIEFVKKSARAKKGIEKSVPFLLW